MTAPNPKPIYRIADLHQSDRPRERLASLGPQALTNAELIAILLRVGVVGENAVEVGQRLLNRFGGIRGLHRAPIKELMEQHAIGQAKAAQIKAAIELGRRLTLESPEERATINSPADAAAPPAVQEQARVAQAYVDDCIARLQAGTLDVPTAAMAKWWTTDMQQKVLDDCVQLHGGYGYMNEYKVAKDFVDTRIQTIYGGTTEIMKELIGRSLGL